MLNENNFKRMCSFYVSDIHLSTMILPYLSEKIEKGEILTTFLEKDIQKEMELLMTKTNIKEKLKEIIRSVNWNRTKLISYENIKEHIKQYKGAINVLVVGTEEYINIVSENLKKYLSENNEVKIKEIDAYMLEENKNKFDEILKRYKYMLNTSGEYYIKEKNSNSMNTDRKQII